MRFDAESDLPELLDDHSGDFQSVTRTVDELSVICSVVAADALAEIPTHRSNGWRCLRVEGATAPSDVPGIIASVVRPLADAGLSVFAVASFDTDHVLVEDVASAAAALAAAGHTITLVSSTIDPIETGYGQRSAVADDAADLVMLADSATRRFFSWIWGANAAAGQSGLERARTSIRTDETSVNHHSHWQVLERDGRIVAGLNSFVMPPISTNELSTPVAEVVAPLNELKALAEGTWYISVAAVFPEVRGLGIGTMLLDLAEQNARATGIEHVTLMVGSFNTGARRFYERRGFREWDRRPFVSFPGSDLEGDWILMVNDLATI